jgi:hypothetical protein
MFVMTTFVFIAGMAPEPLFAEDGEEKGLVGSLAGIVVDPSGNRVAGATVWLVGREIGKDPWAVESFTTDEEGCFVFPRAADKYGDSRSLTPDLLVRDSAGRLGWESNAWTWPGRTPRQDLKIDLVDVGDASGRVMDGDGQPIATAELRVVGLGPGGDERPGQSRIAIPIELADDFTVATAQDGTFTLPRVPLRAEIQARLSAEGCGTPLVSWEVPGTVDFVMMPAGSIRGRLSGSVDAALGGVSLHLYRRSSDDPDRGYRRP